MATDGIMDFDWLKSNIAIFMYSFTDSNKNIIMIAISGVLFAWL